MMNDWLGPIYLYILFWIPIAAVVIGVFGYLGHRINRNLANIAGVLAMFFNRYVDKEGN